jgi:hypothetical protein
MTTDTKAYWTDSEIAAAMDERKLNWIEAVQYLRRKSAKVISETPAMAGSSLG